MIPATRLLAACACLGLACLPVRGADRTIVILGSSTAAGTGATNYDSAFAGRYAKYLGAQNPSWKLVNLAVGGYTTFNVMPTGWKHAAGRPDPDTARNITKALALKPTCLLICMPSNDINNGYAASEYNDNFDSLRNWAVKAGLPVWITTPLPRTALAADKRKLLLELRDRILARYAPRAINFYDSLGDADGNYYAGFNSGDGIHTNDKGHKILFNRVVAANLTGISTGIAALRAYARDGIHPPTLLLDNGRGMLVVAGPAGARFDASGRTAGSMVLRTQAASR